VYIAVVLPLKALINSSLLNAGAGWTDDKRQCRVAGRFMKAQTAANS